MKRKSKKTSSQIEKQIGKVKPGLKTRAMFLIMRLGGQKANDWNPTDKEYWVENGWLDSNRPWEMRNKPWWKGDCKRALYAMVVMLIVGLILILSSTSIGNRMGSNAMRRNGGAMDTGQYERIVDTNTSNFRTVGLISSLVGGFGMLLSGFALYNELWLRLWKVNVPSQINNKYKEAIGVKKKQLSY